MLPRQATAVTVRGLAFAGGLPGHRVGRFGMDPAVVLGQGLADSAGPIPDGAVADLAARDRQLGDGHGEAAGR